MLNYSKSPQFYQKKTHHYQLCFTSPHKKPNLLLIRDMMENQSVATSFLFISTEAINIDWSDR